MSNAKCKINVKRPHNESLVLYNGRIGLLCLHSYYNLDICILQFDNLQNSVVAT